MTSQVRPWACSLALRCERPPDGQPRGAFRGAGAAAAHFEQFKRRGRCARPPARRSPPRPPRPPIPPRLPAEAELPELLVANTDVTIQAPIEDYFVNLGVRLDELKNEFTKIEARTGHDQTFEDYIQGDREFAEGVQQNSQRYYDALKVLRADTQVSHPGAAWPPPVRRRPPPTAPGKRASFPPPVLFASPPTPSPASSPPPPAPQIFYPVPSEVYRDEWDDVIMEDTMEYTHCRYTPVVTEDPRDFGIDGYTLRLQREDRRIRLLICVTLYNEDQDTLRKTMLGICDNLEVLYDKFTLADGRKGLDWQEVAVVIIQDGLQMADPSVIAAATVQGYFSPVVLQQDVLGTPTSLHLFEYTARYKKHAGIENYPPLQVIFGTKTANKGKLDSHCWYFDAISYLIQPEYCVLFDAGTRPMPSALKVVCTHFQRYPNVGALTGELRVERPYRTYLASVQFCEWKVSHLLQKPIESVCGFLTVLPGAFSAFRWLAVDGEPLRRYFYGLYSQAELNAFEANMYLAEDRILCLEIVAKRGCQYRLEYVKEAVAEADPVTRLVGLMKQRRRWLNGTFFAMLYALGNSGRIWTESGHSFSRKIVLTLEFAYLTLNLVVGTWFGIGIFYVMLSTLLKVAFEGPAWLVAIGTAVQLMYMFLLIIQLIVNLKNKPEVVEKVRGVFVAGWAWFRRAAGAGFCRGCRMLGALPALCRPPPEAPLRPAPCPGSPPRRPAPPPRPAPPTPSPSSRARPPRRSTPSAPSTSASTCSSSRASPSPFSSPTTISTLRASPPRGWASS
jgi:chitin synthase